MRPNFSLIATFGYNQKVGSLNPCSLHQASFSKKPKPILHPTLHEGACLNGRPAKTRCSQLGVHECSCRWGKWRLVGQSCCLMGGSFFSVPLFWMCFLAKEKVENREKTYDYQSVAAFQDPLISSWSWNEYSSGTALWLENKPQPVLASGTSSLSPSKDMFPTPLSIGGAKLGCDVLHTASLSRFSDFLEKKIGIVEIWRQHWDSVSVSVAKQCSISSTGSLQPEPAGHLRLFLPPQSASGPPHCISAHTGRGLLKSSLYQLVSASQLENCLLLYEAELWDWIHTVSQH